MYIIHLKITTVLKTFEMWRHFYDFSGYFDKIVLPAGSPRLVKRIGSVWWNAINSATLVNV